MPKGGFRTSRHRIGSSPPGPMALSGIVLMGIARGTFRPWSTHLLHMLCKIPWSRACTLRVGRASGLAAVVTAVVVLVPEAHNRRSCQRSARCTHVSPSASRSVKGQAQERLCSNLVPLTPSPKGSQHPKPRCRHTPRCRVVELECNGSSTSTPVVAPQGVGFSSPLIGYHNLDNRFRRGRCC